MSTKRLNQYRRMDGAVVRIDLWGIVIIDFSLQRKDSYVDKGTVPIDQRVTNS